MTRLVVVGLAACFLVACAGSSTAPTVEWFKSHDAERKEALNNCPHSDQSAGCSNARKARDELQLGSRGYAQPVVAK